MQDKIKIAIEFLKEGNPFQVGGLRFEVDNYGHLQIIGWSQYRNFENITKKIALRELKEIREVFDEMVRNSPELREFIRNKSLEFHLWFDDSGKASAMICSEKDGEISWATDSMRS